MKTNFVGAAACAALFVAGCEPASGSADAARDVEAARAFVHTFYSNTGIFFEVNAVEGPEYAIVPKIPRDHLAKEVPDRSAACAVRVKFTWRDEGRTTHDDWIVWLGSDHKGVGFSSISDGDKWRPYVRSFAQK